MRIGVKEGGVVANEGSGRCIRSEVDVEGVCVRKEGSCVLKT